MMLLYWLSRLFKKPAAATDSNIIAAKVLEISKHPNADRLQIVKLSDGTKEIYPVVCGAFNFKVGDNVVLALPGALIKQNIHSQNHESFVLEKAKIRGIESHGMICAAYELGSSSKIGEGIVLLKSDIQPGTIFEEHMVK